MHDGVDASHLCYCFRLNTLFYLLIFNLQLNDLVPDSEYPHIVYVESERSGNMDNNLPSNVDDPQDELEGLSNMLLSLRSAFWFKGGACCCGVALVSHLHAIVFVGQNQLFWFFVHELCFGRTNNNV